MNIFNVIKKWNQYIKVLEENTPVQNDTSVSQELNNRNVNLEEIKNDVANITNISAQLNSSTNFEDITKKTEDTINSYNNKTDSYITVALAYLKNVADKRIIELKLEQYKTQIPKLHTELQAKIDELNAEIQKTHDNSTSDINITT